MSEPKSGHSSLEAIRRDARHAAERQQAYDDLRKRHNAAQNHLNTVTYDATFFAFSGASDEEYAVAWARHLFEAGKAILEAGGADAIQDDPDERIPKRYARAALQAANDGLPAVVEVAKAIAGDRQHRDGARSTIWDISREVFRRLVARHESERRTQFPDLEPGGGTLNTQEQPGYDPSEREPNTVEQLRVWLAHWSYFMHPRQTGARPPAKIHSAAFIYLERYCNDVFKCWGLEGLHQLLNRYVRQTGKTEDAVAVTTLRELADHFKREQGILPPPPLSPLPTADTEAPEAELSEVSKPNYPRPEAEVLVREWLAKNAKDNPLAVTRDAVAAGTGVSTGGVSNTAAWKAFVERRNAMAKLAVREVPLTDAMQAVIPADCETPDELAKLIEEQEADAADRGGRHKRRHKPS